MDRKWELVRNSNVLGTLVRRKTDQPWVICQFEPTQDFEQVKSLFDRELLLLNANRMDEWESAYSAIQSLNLRLKGVDDSETIEEFLLHIDGEEAWFRF